MRDRSTLYRRVHTHIWRDRKFRALSDRGKILWFFLLTCKENTMGQGLLEIGPATIGEVLGWPAALVEKTLGELGAAGLIARDREARVVWLINAHRYNPPANTSVVRGLEKMLGLLPESDLVNHAVTTINQHLQELNRPFSTPFATRCGTPCDTPSRPLEIRDQRSEKTDLCEFFGEKPTSPCSDVSRDSWIAYAAEVSLEYLNREARRRYRVTDPTKRKLASLLKTYTLGDVLAVTAYLVDKWEDSEKMRQYLRPATIYAADKFGDRLAEAEEAGYSRARKLGPSTFAEYKAERENQTDGNVVPLRRPQ